MFRVPRLALLLALGVACSSVRVSVDYDPETDFSPYRTYAWFGVSQRPTGDYRVDNPLLDSRIHSAIDRELAARGYQLVEDRTPDLLVAYQLAINEKLDVYTIDRTYIGRYGYVVSVPETRVSQYDEGTLVIDIADARQKKLVWRGVGSGRVEQYPTPEETTRKVDETVAQILSRFPPGISPPAADAGGT